MIICIETIIRVEEEDVAVDLQEDGVEDVVVIAIVTNRRVITATHMETAHTQAESVTHREIPTKSMLPLRT